MRTFYYTAEQFLPITIHKAWKFFSAAKNLALITPPELDFRVLTALEDKEIYEGMRIDYKVKPLFGIPLYWQTGISKVQKPSLFIDVQLKGPYRLWEHTHIFIEKEHGVLIKDEVKYQLPFGIAGNIAHALIVRKKVENIFAYRRSVLERIFTAGQI